MDSILVRALWIVSVAGQAAVLFRIWTVADLRYPYAFFASFLAANLSRSLVLVCIDFRSHAYTLIWSVSEPLLLILQLLAVAEVYDHICAAYPGVARYKYRLLAITGVLASTASAFTLVIGMNRVTVWHYFIAVTAKSFVATSSVVFLVLVWALFRHFPVDRGSNLRIHWRVLTVYFSLNAGGLLAMITWPGQVWINIAVLAGVIICYSIWAAAFSAKGELARQPASEDEKLRWTRTQERASTVLPQITLLGVVGLLVHPRECQT